MQVFVTLNILMIQLAAATTALDNEGESRFGTYRLAGNLWVWRTLVLHIAWKKLKLYIDIC
jgi:hypothetical protein